VRETVRSVLLAAEFALTSIKSPAFQPIVVEFAGRGVGWAEGDEHKFQRRMISPAFSLVFSSFISRRLSQITQDFRIQEDGPLCDDLR
jgi:cytochrome P450